MQLSVLSDRQPSPAPFSGPQSIASVRVMRLSITDRCNFRCSYCMPLEGVPWLPRETLLDDSEIVAVVTAAVEVHGIRRFKLTGGEPTLRRGLVNLTRRLRDIQGVEELSLTTNGFLLDELAGPLREAGLDRVTISIDSLRPDRFAAITRTGNLPRVLKGLDALEVAGFTGTKINCVAMRGINDDEFADFAELTLSRLLTVRFIEYMPLGDAAVMHTDQEVDLSERGPAGGCGAQDRGEKAFISEAEIRSAIESRLGPLLPVSRKTEPGVGPANVHRLPGAAGRIGFISAMSEPFCSTCNRLRLTADGVLRSCLFEGGEVDVRGLLRSPLPAIDLQDSLAAAMVRCIAMKPAVHSGYGKTPMNRVGG